MTATAYRFKYALATNSTSASFAQKVPTTTEPTGVGVIDIFNHDLGFATETYMPKYIDLVPYAVIANNDTFDMRLWGWTRIDPVKSGVIWVPQLLIDMSCTIGNIAGTPIAASTLMVDTITLNKGDTAAPVISPANDTQASLLLHLRGVERIEFDFAKTGTGASFNCLYRIFDQN